MLILFGIIDSARRMHMARVSIGFFQAQRAHMIETPRDISRRRVFFGLTLAEI